MSQNRVLIFDTTLRDGEQSPGAAMNQTDKVRIALLLEEMGVDIIEAGFAIASNGDFEAVKAVASAVKKSIVCSLARAQKKDIERAAEAIAPATRGRIHTFIATSPVHMQYKLQMSPDQVLEAIKDSVSYARKFCSDVEWSAEDAGRSDHDFLMRCIETAIKAGAGTVNIPDTVGYTVPDEFGALIREITERVPNIHKAVISTHCHNDLGLAVANSLAGVMNGARQIECTINGLGERAGNAAMEEIVMALHTRSDRLPYTTGIKTEMISRTSKLVSSITGYHVQFNKAVVGRNAFAHESGIHQDGMLKNAKTYEIMSPESIGLTKSELPLGKLSGRNAFKSKLKDLGIDLGDNALTEAFAKFKELADKKRHIYDADLLALLQGHIVEENEAIKLTSLQITGGTKGMASAKIELDVGGDSRKGQVSAEGTVEAIFAAIDLAFGEFSAQLESFQIGAVSEGIDAQAQVTVRLKYHEISATGVGVSNDTLVASALAYIKALNRIMVMREKGHFGVNADAIHSAAAI